MSKPIFLQIVPKESNLDSWIKNRRNVLFVGTHGVGKTAIIKDAFERNFGSNWKYFSASTMDPWTDLVGIPKEIIVNGKPVLDFLRPQEFQNDLVEAIFIDEFNRGHKKTKNAIMELLQFKSINGFKFNNLKVVWAAINPEDSDDHKYDVEELDAAQRDRFQIQIEIPYKPNAAYFTSKYGKEIAEIAIEWWNELGEKLQKDVSPRRLEYAVDEALEDDGDPAFVLCKQSNPNKLKNALKHGSPKATFKKLLKDKNKDKMKSFLNNSNNYDAIENDLINSKSAMAFCLGLLSSERFNSLISKEKKVKEYVFNPSTDNSDEIIEKIVDLLNSQELGGSSELGEAAVSYLRKKKTKMYDKHNYGVEIPKVTVQFNKNFIIPILNEYQLNGNAKVFNTTEKRKTDMKDVLLECSNMTKQQAEYSADASQKAIAKEEQFSENIINMLINSVSTEMTKEEADMSLTFLDNAVYKIISKDVVAKYSENNENMNKTINTCVAALYGGKLPSSFSKAELKELFYDRYPNIFVRLMIDADEISDSKNTKLLKADDGNSSFEDDLSGLEF